MRKTTYNIEYNPVSKTWCLFKYIEGHNSYNFYPLVQSVDKKDCQKKLDELKKKITESTRKNQKKVWSTVYKLYRNDELIDTDTRKNLINKYKVPQRVFNNYYYKKDCDYRVEKITK